MIRHYDIFYTNNCMEYTYSNLVFMFLSLYFVHFGQTSPIYRYNLCKSIILLRVVLQKPIHSIVLCWHFVNIWSNVDVPSLTREKEFFLRTLLDWSTPDRLGKNDDLSYYIEEIYVHFHFIRLHLIHPELSTF